MSTLNIHDRIDFANLKHPILTPEKHLLTDKFCICASSHIAWHAINLSWCPAVPWVCPAGHSPIPISWEWGHPLTTLR